MGDRMKIALLMSGQPRLVKEGYSGYKKSIGDHYDVDTFCFLWFDKSKVGTYQADEFARHNSWGQRKNTKWSGKELDEIKDLYNPVSLKVANEYDWSLLPEGYPEIDSNHIHKGKNNPDDVEIYAVKEAASELYAMNQVMQQLKDYQEANGFEYDWVIRMRSDFYLNKRIVFENLDNREIHIPNIGRLPQRIGMHGLANSFAMSNFYNMQIYMSGDKEFFNREMNY